MTLQTNLLKGELVYLTAMKIEDVTHHTQWFNDIEIARLTRNEVFKPKTYEQQEEWYRNSAKGDAKTRFSIATIVEDKPIGILSVLYPNWQARNVNLAIIIGERDYLGKGYGTDAMQIILRYAFMEMNMNRVQLEVISHNERAIKSYEKVGFTHEGTLREFIWRDGIYYDMLIMGILCEDWMNL